MRNIGIRLINKYQLSGEDIDDIKQEIAISEFKYGYSRDIEHIIIDYLSKYRNYKRSSGGGKRTCRMQTEEYSEVDHGVAYRNFVRGSSSDDMGDGGGIGQNQYTYLCAKAATSGNLKKILNMLEEGLSLKEIGNRLFMSESRASQIVKAFRDKVLILSLVSENKQKEIAKTFWKKNAK